MEEGLEKLFTIFFIGMVVWACLSVLVFYARLRFAQYVAKEKAKRKKKESKKGGKGKTKQSKSKSSNVIEFDKDYELAKNAFNNAMKNGQLSRQQILGLKKLINVMLDGVKKYDNYYFKNDAHEIYVKLKDDRLSTLDYQEIINYITTELQVDSNSVTIENQDNKKTVEN